MSIEELQQYIKDNLYTRTHKFNTAILRPDRFTKNKIYPDVMEYTKGLPENATMSERLYCILHNLSERPKCPVCGKPRPYEKQTQEYGTSCGDSACRMITRKKYDHSTLAKTGWIKTNEEFKDAINNIENTKLCARDECISYIEHRYAKTDRGRVHMLVDRAEYRNHKTELLTIINLTPEIPVDINDLRWNERFYRVYVNMHGDSRCEVCGKPTSFQSSIVGYRRFCSSECVHTSERLQLEKCEKHLSVVVDGLKKQGYAIVSGPTKLNYGRYDLKCDRCGTIHDYDLSDGRWQHIHCPTCDGIPSSSYGEREVADFVNSIYDGPIEQNYRVDGKELDIYIPGKKLGIEFDGVYWHSELVKKSKYNLSDKTAFFNSMGISVLHFFDKEWDTKREIVKSMIENRFGVTKRRIYARETSIVKISNGEKSDFLNTNHIQGDDRSTIHYGLKFGNELVSVMTFGERSLGGKSKLEMIRFCSALHTSVIGGAGKLLAHFKKEYCGNATELTTYANLRYSNGNLYKKLGFTYIGTSKPDYFYFKSYGPMYHRCAFQKHLLKNKLERFDPKLTEWENMAANGWNRIFDCGNLVYQMPLNTIK